MDKAQEVRAPTALDALVASLVSTAFLAFAAAVNLSWVFGVFWMAR
jgi:hypothetical protein